MTVDVTNVKDRLATLKQADEDLIRDNTRISYIQLLNESMGRDQRKVKHITYGTTLHGAAVSISKQLKIYNAKAIDASYEFTEYFKYKEWSELDPRDIAMMGHLAADIMAPAILYDERTYTFHYAEDTPMSQVYDELLEEWRKLPFWKRIWHSRPEIEIPKYFKKEKGS